MSFLGNFTRYPEMCIGFFLVIFPFKSAMFLHQIAWGMSVSLTITGQSIIYLLWTIHLKSLTDGYPSYTHLVYIRALLPCG